MKSADSLSLLPSREKAAREREREKGRERSLHHPAENDEG